jgi:hypothetical protein
MAITRYSNFDKTVNTIIDRNNILNKVNGMTVVVLDAIADINVGTGKAVYRWDSSDESWILISKGTTDTMNFITEEGTITNSEINLSYIPVNNQIWNGLIINNDLIYADLNTKQVIISNGKITNIPVEYNGMILRVTYAYGTIAAQVITAIDSAVTEKFDELSGFSVDAIQAELDRTQLNIGLDSNGNYEKIVTANYIADAISVKDATQKLDTELKNVNNKVPDLTNLNTNIVPTTNGVLEIGSSTNRFKAIYVDEAYLSTNTLYIGNVPVLGTNADTIIVKADPDQSLLVKTTGTGSTQIQSATAVDITTSGTNADVKIQATGTNSKVRLSGTGGIEFSNPTTVQSDFNVTGNLTVTGNIVHNGSNFTVNATTVTTKDNIITLNSGEVGSGVTAGKAGIQIDRGEAADYQLIFDETDDKFKVGEVNGTFETLATREYVDAQILANSGSGSVEEISTSEFQTNLTRNTKQVYGIEINCGLLVNSNIKEIAFTFNATYNYWLDNQNSYCYNSDESYPINYVGNIGESISCFLDKKNNKIKISCSNDKSSFTAKIIIYYTK